MNTQWFLTGTDTNIGKTITAIILLKKAANQGFKTAGYKPIASGSIKTIHGLKNNDTLLLKKNSTVNLSYQQINPFFFPHAGPPHIFNTKKKKINFNDLDHGLNIINQHANWIIIEGIGGWYTPISQCTFLSDWIKYKQIPVILVVGLKLGCINHAILTGKEIIQSNLKFSGWIANYISDKEKYGLDYINIIQKYIPVPFLGTIPYIYDMNNISEQKIILKLPE
ncbi:dethiobiotin synthase [Buchnera aphidicola]|uniref:ATP-dependent dethiobiotin synthetase BioD n=1 Tax=Buchnera aphidicola (Stegophylla sp.) TaxID=2315800 RepID=A0A4D6YB87_9GAMM|nr:dethiobiotin synthase [Buchnera aphidicola (Stegophylla sp.)]QCI26362.1 dethiobiotin synthase [Buchnera aphidicola (Stegophylla sp.)]